MVRLILDMYHPNMRAWALQRATALVMVIYVVFMLAMLLLMPPHDYLSWKSFMANEWVKLLTLLFLWSLYAHAWLGVKHILVDYIKPLYLRWMLTAATISCLGLYSVWSVQILWG